MICGKPLGDGGFVLSGHEQTGSGSGRLRERGVPGAATGCIAH